METNVSVLPQDTRRASDLLRELILENPAETITLGDLLKTLDDRAFGFVMFLLAFPVCLPMPPGFSTVMGVLLLPIVLQFLMGRRRPHLPKSIRRRTLDRATLAKAVRMILPGLIWMEKLFRPRWHLLTDGVGEKISGIILLVLALIFITPLPPPLHFLPAFGIALMSLGIMERDGLVILIGAVVGIGGLTAVGVMGKIVFRWIRKLTLLLANT